MSGEHEAVLLEERPGFEVVYKKIIEKLFKRLIFNLKIKNISMNSFLDKIDQKY